MLGELQTALTGGGFNRRQIPRVADTRIVRIVAVFYFALSLTASVLIAARAENLDLFHPYSLPKGNWMHPVFLSIVIVLFVHAISVLSVRKWRSLRKSARELQAWFGKLSRSEILFIALCSGIAEELFFRGWLLNEAGLLLSSLIFGAVHFPPHRAWIFWPLFAFSMGLVLGALCLWTETLFYAAAVHAGINFLNILRFSRMQEMVS